MITIGTTPQKYTPAFNPVVFSLTSDNYSQPDFKFVADVYSGDGQLLATLKYQPQAVGTDPVTIDVSRILYELVSADYCKLNEVVSPSIVVTSGGALSDYSVQFGEQYNNVIYANLASYSGYIFNGAINGLRLPFFNHTGYLNNRWLTRFARQVARKRDSIMMSLMQSDVTAITGFDLKIYDLAGTNIYSTTISNPYNSLSASNNRLLHLHIGFDYLYSRLAFSSTIYNTAAYYTLQPIGGSVCQIDLYSLCERFPGTRLHFLNELGGFDSFNFTLDTKQTQTTERKTYQRQPVNKATGYDSTNKRFEVLTRNYYSTYTEKQKLISDYLTDTESRMLAELLKSPLVYMETDASVYGGAGNILIPVTLTTTEWEIKKGKTDKLFNLELDVEMGFENVAQVI
ncbi:hypothetical protein [Chitinophaga sp.]|uniref:hypothetical protein n=1 Tax=Chitinophaga sp. TaxID=1869181 RepID=UPI0031D45CE2